MMKKFLLAGIAIIGLSACDRQPQPQTETIYVPVESSGEEEEDCDYDDMLERDEDCGFSKSHKTHKTTVINNHYGRPTPKATYRPTSKPAYVAPKSSYTSSKPSYGTSSSSYKPSTSSSSYSSRPSSSSSSFRSSPARSGK